MSDTVWYVVHTKPQREAVAYGNIVAQEFTAFLPLGKEAGKPARSQAQLTFALLGVAGAALVLMLFDFLWKGRFLAVRRPLVDSEKL